MSLLEFGMENEKSGSKVKRALAKGALAAAKKHADLYEAYIEKKGIEIPESPGEDEKMLQQIRRKIEQTED